MSRDVLRVVVDARPVNPGMTGIGRYSLNLLYSLDTLPDLEVRALMSPGRVTLAGSLNRVKPVIIDRVSDAWVHLELPQLLTELEADVFHTPLFVLPAVRPCPSIITIHDVIPRSRPDLTSEGFREFFEAHVPRAIKAADRVVTVSEFSKADLLKHFPDAAGKVEVIHQPISPRFRPLSVAELRPHLARLGLEPDYALFVGALDRRKGLESLLDAWEFLRAQGETPPLVIAGAPASEGFQLEGEIARRGLGGAVRLVGRVAEEDLPAVYSGAAVFVFPSLYEGWGLPVLEAMACGTPVVTTDVSSLPEAAGNAAILVAPGSPRDLADGVRRVLSSPALADDLRARGKARAGEFTVVAQARNLQALYRTILQEAR